MKWWNKVFRRRKASSLHGQIYVVFSTLYSLDGNRSAEIRVFENGETYLLENDWIDGVFKERHGGSLVGPFASPKLAEEFIVATSWFTGKMSPRS